MKTQSHDSLKSYSMAALARAKFSNHKLAVTSLWVLVVFYAVAVFADFFSPYPYDLSVPAKANHPPTPLQWVDEQGRFHVRPFIYETNLKIVDGRKIYEKDTRKKYFVRFFTAGKEYRALGFIPCRMRWLNVDAPGVLYILGSDWNGRDVFSRIIYGSRISLSIGLVGVAISTVIGLIVGGISGYFGGWVDTVLMRAVELIMSVPSFYLMLTLRGVLPLEMSSEAVYMMLIVILSFIGWAGMARVVRGIVLSLRESEYVLAAKALGASSFSIIRKHILPHTSSYVIVSATLSIPSYILGESALSLLGLGIAEPQVSWGNMLTRAMSITDIRFYPWILIAGVAIFIVTMCFNLLGDGLRDALDPKSGT